MREQPRGGHAAIDDLPRQEGIAFLVAVEVLERELRLADAAQAADHLHAPRRLVRAFLPVEGKPVQHLLQSRRGDRHIDEIDRRIIRELQRNASLSHAALADKVGASAAELARLNGIKVTDIIYERQVLKVR